MCRVRSERGSEGSKRVVVVHARGHMAVVMGRSGIDGNRKKRYSMFRQAQLGLPLFVTVTDKEGGIICVQIFKQQIRVTLGINNIASTH